MWVGCGERQNCIHVGAWGHVSDANYFFILQIFFLTLRFTGENNNVEIKLFFAPKM